jgi:molecular chaperone GrpE (heat shock protein)
MSDDVLSSPPLASAPAARAPDIQTLGSSTLFKLLEEMIRLRGRNEAQHKLFEQTLARARDDLKGSFDSFARDTQRAYLDLRNHVLGEKKFSLGLLSELLEVGQDLEGIVAHRPPLDDREALERWVEAIEIESRKVQAALQRLGIYPYDAVISSPYNPALHERVGSARVEGMGPLLIAEQRERGYASQQPEFVLRRPKVIVSE